MTVEQRIEILLGRRLEQGRERYGAFRPEGDPRDYAHETLEELLDACVYLAVEVVRYKDQRERETRELARLRSLLVRVRGIASAGPRFVDRHLEAAADSVADELLEALRDTGTL